ncbi:MAG: TolC family protein, partial [Pirellulales bacterium]
LDAKIAARNQALETWRVVNAQFATGFDRREADREAQAREQYYLFQAQVEDALSGSPRKGTQSGNISGGGVFQAPGGVYGSERKLRFLLGLPVNDCRLIRPADEPTTVRVCFDWDETLCEALIRRIELRRQKWFVKRRELELIAARNYLLPRLDAVGLYRWRGFGDDLFHANGDGGPFDNAFQNLTNGDYQEWQMGLQFNMPIGFRQALAGVRNAQLQLTRERAVLSEAELRVSHDLGEAVAEMDRAYSLIHTNFNRRVAAEQQHVLLQYKYKNPPSGRPVPIEFLLDAQRRRADAETSYYRSLVEYTLAIKNVHFEKGSLLDFNEIYLAEGPWQDKA